MIITISPTEQYIAYCIFYGDDNLAIFYVKKALQVAMQHQAVEVRENVILSEKDETLQKYVNIMDTNAKYPKETLDTHLCFLSSDLGYSEIEFSI
jgi:hypothetical protein